VAQTYIEGRFNTPLMEVSARPIKIRLQPRKT